MKPLMRWLGYALSSLIYILPPGGRRVFGVFLALLWFDVLRIRRKVVLNNLQIAFPDWSESQRIDCARKSLMHLGWNFVDYSLMPFLSKKNYSNYVEFHGLEKVNKALSEGKGLLVLTLHMGAGDVITAGLALHGIPSAIVTKEFKIKWLNELWFELRTRLGVGLIGARNSSFALLRALKNNQMVIIPLDQFTGPPIGVRTTFFGKETGTAAGLAVMAQRSGAPVISTYVRRLPSGKSAVYFEKWMSTSGEIEIVTQAFNDELENFVRLYPEQWMWLHKRWKRFVVN